MRLCDGSTFVNYLTSFVYINLYKKIIKELNSCGTLEVKFHTYIYFSHKSRTICISFDTQHIKKVCKIVRRKFQAIPCIPCIRRGSSIGAVSPQWSALQLSQLSVGQLFRLRQANCCRRSARLEPTFFLMFRSDP